MKEPCNTELKHGIVKMNQLIRVTGGCCVLVMSRNKSTDSIDSTLASELG